jgi:hypothetical protein
MGWAYLMQEEAQRTIEPNTLTYLIESLCQVLPELCTLAQFFCHDTHTQNGVTESKHHYILETARALMLASFIPPHFWVEVVPTITYLINIQPSLTL